MELSSRAGWVVAFVAVGTAACGGNVVASHGGAGGGSGATTSTGTTTSTTTVTTTVTTTSTSTSTTTTTSTSSTTSTSDPCPALTDAFTKALAAATQCNACMDADHCMNGPLLEDTCGCPVGLVSSPPDLADTAKAAHDAWVGAGCGPWACGKPCSAAQKWACLVGPGGDCTGTCGPVF